LPPARRPAIFGTLNPRVLMKCQGGPFRCRSCTRSKTGSSSGPASLKRPPRPAWSYPIPPKRSPSRAKFWPSDQVDVKVGDTVVYSKYGGTEITVEGEDLLILSSRDVLAKLA